MKIRLQLSEDFLDDCDRYVRSNPVALTNLPPSVIVNGLAAFHQRESTGRSDVALNEYGTYLLDGKRWWEWTLQAHKDLYDQGEWPGWDQLERDYAHDPRGLQQIRDRVAHKRTALANRLGVTL